MYVCAALFPVSSSFLVCCSIHSTQSGLPGTILGAIVEALTSAGEKGVARARPEAFNRGQSTASLWSGSERRKPGASDRMSAFPCVSSLNHDHNPTSSLLLVLLAALSFSRPFRLVSVPSPTTLDGAL